MNKILLTLLLSLSLTGCFYQSVNSNDIETAQAVCLKNQATVVEIRAHIIGSELVVCSNRKSFQLQEE